MVWTCEHGHTKEEHPNCYTKYFTQTQAPQITLTGETKEEQIKLIEQRNKFVVVGFIDKSYTGATVRVHIGGQKYYCYTLDLEMFLKGKRKEPKLFERI